MSATCLHGFAPDSCLICRTLGTGTGPATQVLTPADSRGASQERPPPARPDVVYSPPPVGTRHRSVAGSLLLVLAALLAVGAAVWIMAAVVLTVLHVLELVAVGAGCGWVGYKLGHFRGSRHPRRRA